MEIKNYTPLVFLASLGAGGVSVMPFVLMQYTIEHGPGLITRSQLWARDMSAMAQMYYYALEAVMVLFVLIHIGLTIWFAIKLVSWIRTDSFPELIKDPLKNTAILAPLISLLMTMNVLIGPVRYFSPAISGNLEQLFLHAMLFWSFMFFVVMFTEIKLLEISFRSGFDINRIHFGWLLHPFLLGMLTVVGTGIAAMSKDVVISSSAAFMSLICGSMGIFLLIVKMVILFKSHFQSTGLPEKHFLPSFLIVIPNITLFAISAFRLGHYLEGAYGFEMGAYFYLVVGLSFGFEFWYMLFGFSLLVDYFRQNHFKDFYVTQWGLICPLVAFAVLGAFAYNLVLSSPVLYFIIVVTMAVSVFVYFELLTKHIRCTSHQATGISCST